MPLALLVFYYTNTLILVPPSRRLVLNTRNKLGFKIFNRRELGVKVFFFFQEAYMGFKFYQRELGVKVAVG